MLKQRPHTRLDSGVVCCFRNGSVNAEGTPKSANKYVNLADEERTNHILNGDSTGGGHMYPGQPGKSVFPESWSGDKIMHEVSNIATDPAAFKNAVWTKGAPGSMYTKAGAPSRCYVEGVRDGVKIRVVVEPATGKIVTAFPVN